jgi:hypothetical protein
MISVTERKLIKNVDERIEEKTNLFKKIFKHLYPDVFMKYGVFDFDLAEREINNFIKKQSNETLKHIENNPNDTPLISNYLSGYELEDFIDDNVNSDLISKNKDFICSLIKEKVSKEKSADLLFKVVNNPPPSE